MSQAKKAEDSARSIQDYQSNLLSSASKMGKLIGNFDWSKSKLGALSTWPESLKTTVNIILGAPLPMVLLWGPEGVMLYNDAYATFAGKKHPGLLGVKVTKGWPEIADFNKNVLRTCLGRGETLTYKNQKLILHRHNFPEEVWMDLSYSPVINDEGKPAGVLAIVVDISDQVMAHKQAEESEQHFRFMAETLPLKIFTTSPTGKVTYFNPQWSEYTGISMDELHRLGVRQLLHPEDLENSLRSWRRGLKNGKPLQNEQRLRRHDGHYRRHLSFARPMLDDTGKIISWFGSMTDVEDVLQTAIQKDKLELITANLKAQHTQLLAIDKVKDEFIALASHQLRTPATAVKQYVDLVLNGFFGPLTAEQVKNLQIAYDSNERELNIINDLLKTAQIDSNTYTLHKQPLDIAVIINEVISDFRPALELKNQTVVLKDLSKEAKVLADRIEMKLVLINLLENASKYSHPGQPITIRLNNSGKFFEIEIRDKGVGINKKDFGHIFDKFTRINNELSDTVTGSGLGLYWVKQIIMLHGGKIKVNSSPGKGSTFIIKLPL